MRTTRLNNLLLVPLWLLLFACAKEENPTPDGVGQLVVSIDTGAFSRADSPGDGNIYDGGGMEDLTLVLVNPNGVVAAIERFTDLTGDEQRVKRVSFEHLDVGNYTVCAYANTRRSYLNEAETLLSTLAVGDAFGAAERDALFTTRTGRDTPAMSATEPLLVTAVQEVAIEMGTTTTSLVLLRPIVRFEVRLHNHATYPMRVTDVTTSDFNPSTGYLLPHGGVIPSSAAYRALPAYDTFTGGTDVEVAAGANTVIYRTELFENRAADYTLGMELSISVPMESASTQNVNTLAAGTQYALLNRSSDRYLIDNGGQLSAVDALTDAPTMQHALWTFSGTGSGYLTNVATGNRYYRNTTAASSGQNLTFTKSGNYYRISYSTGSGRNPTTYYLHDSNNAISYQANTSNTSNSRDWRLQSVTIYNSTTTLTKTVEASQLYVIDDKTAVARPMTEQLRNQYITVTVNAYYDELEGIFNFEVLPWNEKRADVEFN